MEIEAIEALRKFHCFPTQALWNPPHANQVKINYDASFSQHYNTSISGIIARNENGDILAACTYSNYNVADAFIAEAHACDQAVSFGLEMGFRSVIIEGDSFTVTKILQTVKDDKSILRPIVENIRSNLSSFCYITFSHVGRQGNLAAHALAKTALWSSIPRLWVEEVPAAVVSVAIQDWQNWISHKQDC